MRQKRKNFFLTRIREDEKVSMLPKKHYTSQKFVKFSRNIERSQNDKKQIMVETIKSLKKPEQSQIFPFLFADKIDEKYKKCITYLDPTSVTPECLLKDDKISGLEFKVKKSSLDSQKNLHSSFAQLFMVFKTMVTDFKKLVEKFKSLFSQTQIFEHFAEGELIKNHLNNLNASINSIFSPLLQLKQENINLPEIQKLLKNDIKPSIREFQLHQQIKFPLRKDSTGKKRKFSNSEHDFQFCRSFFSKMEKSKNENDFSKKISTQKEHLSRDTTKTFQLTEKILEEKQNLLGEEVQA